MERADARAHPHLLPRLYYYATYCLTLIITGAARDLGTTYYSISLDCCCRPDETTYTTIGSIGEGVARYDYLLHNCKRGSAPAHFCRRGSLASSLVVSSIHLWHRERMGSCIFAPYGISSMHEFNVPHTQPRMCAYLGYTTRYSITWQHISWVEGENGQLRLW